MVIEGQIAPARRYETLGAFRFILAFMVFYGHMTIMVVRHDPSRHFNLQNAGVSLFFLLSGYIIFSSYDKFYQGRPTRYLANRFVRIYPPFWAVYFLTIIPVLMSGHSEVQGYTFGDVVSDATLIGNYLGISTLAPMQQTWSLLVELQFYLMAFFFFLILERFPSRRLAEAIFLILTAALYVYVWQTASFNRFFGGAQWAPFFAMGIAVYYVKRDGLRNWLAVIAVAVFCVLALHQFYTRYVLRLEIPSTSFYIVAFLMALFVLMVSPHGPRLPAKFDRVLGDMTYLLFLIHYPVMKLFQESKPFSDVVNVTIVTVLCVVGTVGLFYLFEAPIDRIRDRIRGKVIE